jgi:hypothetical protein
MYSTLIASVLHPLRFDDSYDIIGNNKATGVVFNRFSAVKSGS